MLIIVVAIVLFLVVMVENERIQQSEHLKMNRKNYKRLRNEYREGRKTFLQNRDVWMMSLS